VILLLAALLLLVPAPARAADTVDIRAQWKRTVEYGIDTQVLDVVSRLKDFQDSSLDPELAAVLKKSRNSELRKAILDLFTSLKATDGEESARAILAAWQDEKPDTVILAVQYLSAVEAAGISPALLTLTDGSDQGLAAAALDALGKSGDKTVTKTLLEKLANPDFPDARKGALILALGNLKDPSAVEALVGIAKNGDEDRIRRMYAADSLGKIGDEKAIPVLEALLGDGDALVRAYASSALAGFDVGLVIGDLIQGLRDDNWRVRVQCAKALGRSLPPSRIPEVVDILSYKAELDPASQVRLEAIRALGEIGNEPGLKFLLDLYKRPRTPLESREAALSAAARKGLSQAAVETVRGVLADASGSRDQRTILSTAKVLSTVRSGSLESILAGFLDSPDPSTRIYGIRGTALNGFTGLRHRLLGIADTDPNPLVQKEARAAADKL
jgi:HEAT repeat protein